MHIFYFEYLIPEAAELSVNIVPTQKLHKGLLSNEDRFLTSHFLLLTLAAALDFKLQSL